MLIKLKSWKRFKKEYDVAYKPIDPKILKKRKEKFLRKWYFKLSLKQRKFVHALTLPIITIRRFLSGYSICILGGENMPFRTRMRPLILAVNHVAKMDIEIVAEVIREHYYLLTNDFEGLHQILDGHIAAITGTIFVDPFDADDGRRAKCKMIEVLEEGANIMWFPEGEWNLSPNVLVLPLFWGMAEVAWKTNALILPIGIQVFDKKYYVNIGKVYDMRSYLTGDNPLSAQNKQSAMDDLRERLATLVWEIIESRPQEKRKDIPEDYHQHYIRTKLKEWRFNTQERIEKHYLTNRLLAKEQKRNISE